MNTLYRAGLCAALALVASGSVAAAALVQGQPLVEAGRRVVAEHCSGCHAIGSEGDSPLGAAPPLRELYARYPDETMTEAFKQGLINSHPSMPTFSFGPNELSAILAYLKSIQVVQRT